jgi:hypothetical protein
MPTNHLRAWYLATASIVAVASASQCLSAPSDTTLTDDDLFLVSLKLGNLTLADSITAYNVNNELCLDLTQTVRALDFPIEVDPAAGFAKGWFLHEDQQFSLDVRKKKILIGKTESSVGNLEVREISDGYCVSISALKRWFPISFETDLSNAQVKLITREPLPIEKQIERRAQQAKLQRLAETEYAKIPSLKTPYEYFRPPAVDFTSEISVEKLPGQNSLSSKRSYTVLAAGEVAKLSSEVFLSSDNKGVPQELRGKLYRRSPEANLLGKLRATEFAFGDISGRGSSLIADGEAGRGASITNVPLDAPQTFDRTTFRGDVPAGWEVELYRNGQLFNYSEAATNGRYEFRDIPLIFGLNNFEIIAYGPQGQIKKEQRSISVGPQAVPPGQFWYSAGAYEAGRNLITLSDVGRVPNIRGARGFASVQYGLSSKTTLSLNAESLEYGLRQHNYLELSATQTLGPVVAGISGTLDLQGGQALELLAFGNALSADISTRHAFFNKYESQRISDTIASRHSFRVYTTPKFFSRPLPISVDLIYDRRRNGPDLLDITNRFNWSVSGLLLAHETRFTTSIGATSDSTPTRWVNSLLWNAGWNDVRIRGEFDYRLTQGAAIERVNAGIDWYQSDQFQIRAQGDWSPPDKSWRFGVGLNQLFDVFTLGVRAEIGSRGALNFGINLATGLSPFKNRVSGNDTWKLSRYRPAITGEAAVHVFEDLNDNGLQDPDEVAISGVGFAAGSAESNSVTDADGIVRIKALRPFVHQNVAIDETTLPDTTYRPKYKSISLSPRPGISERVDYPVYPTGDIDGTLRIQKSDSIVVAGGAKLQVLDSEGKIVASGVSDYEGYFIIEGLKYGRYGLRIDPVQAKALGLKTNTMRLVEITRDRPSLSGQDIILTAPTITPEMLFAEISPHLRAAPLWAN